MKIVVTGGTGFIGRRLIRTLLDRKHEVTVLSRDPEAARRRFSVARISSWNPASEPAPADMLASTDAVVHLVGESIAKGRWTAAKKRRIVASRVTGTRNLVAGIAAASPAPRILVSGSAIGYYGPRGDEPVDESSPPGGDFLAGVARAWEEEARRAEPHGLRVVTLRTGIVLGKGGGALRPMLVPFKLFAGGPVGSGEQWMSWIHIDDLCGLILHALARADLSGPMNGTAPNPVRNREFAQTLGGVLGRPAFMPTPGFALRLLLGEMADALLLSGQRVLPKRALETEFRFRHPGLEESLTDILRQNL